MENFLAIPVQHVQILDDDVILAGVGNDILVLHKQAAKAATNQDSRHSSGSGDFNEIARFHVFPDSNVIHGISCAPMKCRSCSRMPSTDQKASCINERRWLTVVHGGFWIGIFTFALSANTTTVPTIRWTNSCSSSTIPLSSGSCWIETDWTLGCKWIQRDHHLYYDCQQVTEDSLSLAVLFTRCIQRYYRIRLAAAGITVDRVFCYIGSRTEITWSSCMQIIRKCDWDAGNDTIPVSRPVESIFGALVASGTFLGDLVISWNHVELDLHLQPLAQAPEVEFVEPKCTVHSAHAGPILSIKWMAYKEKRDSSDKQHLFLFTSGDDRVLKGWRLHADSEAAFEVLPVFRIFEHMGRVAELSFARIRNPSLLLADSNPILNDINRACAFCDAIHTTADESLQCSVVCVSGGEDQLVRGMIFPEDKLVHSVSYDEFDRLVSPLPPLGQHCGAIRSAAARSIGGGNLLVASGSDSSTIRVDLLDKVSIHTMRSFEHIYVSADQRDSETTKASTTKEFSKALRETPRSALFLSDNSLLVCSDKGRILTKVLDDRSVRSHVCLFGFQSHGWNLLYEDPQHIAFAPQAISGALEIGGCRLVFVGNGIGILTVLCVSDKHVDEFGNRTCSKCLFSRIKACSQGPVMEVFVFKQSKTCIAILVSTCEGTLELIRLDLVEDDEIVSLRNTHIASFTRKLDASSDDRFTAAFMSLERRLLFAADRLGRLVAFVLPVEWNQTPTSDQLSKGSVKQAILPSAKLRLGTSAISNILLDESRNRLCLISGDGKMFSVHLNASIAKQMVAQSTEDHTNQPLHNLFLLEDTFRDLFDIETCKYLYRAVPNRDLDKSLLDATSIYIPRFDAVGSVRFVGGFRSVHFLLADLLTQTELFRVECGGWRRVNALHVRDENPLLGFSFVFWRGNKFHCIQQTFRESLSQVFRSTSLARNNFHGLRINSVSMLPLAASHRYCDQLFVTASEDTMCKLMLVTYAGTGNLAAPTIHVLQTLSAHESGVLATSSCLFPSGSSYIFTGGGMNQVFCWSNTHFRDKAQHALEQVGLSQAACISESVDNHASATLRVTSLACVLIQGQNGCWLFVGRSNASLSVYQCLEQEEIDSNRPEKAARNSILATSKTETLRDLQGAVMCLVACSLGSLGSLLVCGDTRGSVVVYCLRDKSLSLAMKLDKVHDSGTNCLACCSFACNENAETQCATVLVVSGGDDEKVVLNVIHVTSRSEALPYEILLQASFRKHAAAISGVAIRPTSKHKYTILAIGLDQRLSSYTAELKPAASALESSCSAKQASWDVVHSSTRCVNVADTAGVALLSSRHVLVFGFGLEATPVQVGSAGSGER